MCSKLPLRYLRSFPVLSRVYAHAQLSSLYPLSTFTAFHVRKNTRLSMPAQLQCLRSGAWEPGSEAIAYVCMCKELSFLCVAVPGRNQTLFCWAHYCS